MKDKKDYEQLYYDTLYELKKTKEKIVALEEELELLKKVKNNKLASVIYQELTKYKRGKKKLSREDMTLFAMWCTEKVKDENEKLKRQVEKVLNDYCRLDAYNRTQQKEFIKYLEEEINNTTSRKEQLRNKKAILVLETRNSNYNTILKKYKSIIGVSDDKTN